MTTTDMDVRASFLRFPAWTQHFWTWLTGKALPGQQPLIRHTWFSYLMLTLAAFFAGLILAALGLVHGFGWWWLLVPGGWVLSLAAARTMILVIAHQCIHKQFSGARKLDNVIGELVTVLNIYWDANTFKVEHFDSHHQEHIFATATDPPVQSLLKLGFQPQMSKRRLWLQLAIMTFSPVFYLSALADRLKCNVTAGTWRRIGFVAWVGLLLSLPVWLPHGWRVLLLGFGVPILLGNQLSAVLDRLGEHLWLSAPDAAHGRKYYHVASTSARFCGRVVPPASLPLHRKLLAWQLWVLSMVCYHLPSRILVVVGDLPNHDFHHRYPATPDWMVAAYARQKNIDDGREGGPPYTEVWGLGQAIDRTFAAISAAPAIIAPAAHASAPARARGG